MNGWCGATPNGSRALHQKWAVSGPGRPSSKIVESGCGFGTWESSQKAIFIFFLTRSQTRGYGTKKDVLNGLSADQGVFSEILKQTEYGTGKPEVDRSSLLYSNVAGAEKGRRQTPKSPLMSTLVFQAAYMERLRDWYLRRTTRAARGCSSD